MNSFIGWVGGKRALRRTIIEKFPADVDRYIEVFGGAGWVLFGKPQIKNQLEVFNDLDDNLVNLFRCVKFHCTELQRELSFLLTARSLFYEYREQLYTPGMTDIQRAARFFYLVKMSFGSDYKTFATSSKTIDNALLRLQQVQERLKGVVIEHKDFADLIKTYDRKNALFYLDPPYQGTEKYYKAQFTVEDHTRLKSVLDSIKGRFILSYNDDPFIRNLYSNYNITEVKRKNLLSGTDNNKGVYNEIIIDNL